MKGPYWILQADVQRPDEQSSTTKYITYDKASGGYPYWPENFSGAHLHRKEDEVFRELDVLMKATPTAYNAGPSDAFKSFCLPNDIHRMFDGPTNVDGLYQAQLRVIKLSGDSAADMKVEVVRDLSMKAVQHSKVPNKEPEITWTENPVVYK